MKCLQISALALSAAVLGIASNAHADSRNAPPSPPPAEDYTESYGYADMNGAPPPQWDAPAGGDYGAAYGDDHDHHWRHDHMRGPSGPQMGYDYGVVDDTVMYQGHWVGSITGSWNGGPVRTWEGTFDSTNGQTHWHGQYVDRPTAYAPPPGAPPAYAPPAAYRAHGYGYGGYGYGYGYRYAAPAYEEVLVPGQPIVTKTVHTYVSYVDVPVRTHYVYNRVWHTAYHPVCSCVAPRPRPRVRPHVIQGS